MIDTPKNSFDYLDWKAQFTKASAQKQGFRELRKDIFQQTIKFVEAGEYYSNGKKVTIDSSKVSQETHFFDEAFSLAPEVASKPTRFTVIEADCLEAAQLLQNAGYNVCVLNMANRRNPGGGVLDGSGAQEENLFRRSNLFKSLYQFAPYAGDYNLEVHPKQYPLDRNFGAVYSSEVRVFRASEASAYYLLENPYKMSFVTVAAISRPALDKINDKYFIRKDLVEGSKNKIRTILRVAAKFGHNALVLSAFGCGAFRNPPEHMATLFKEVFAEAEFLNRFEVVVFAIIDDHNAHLDVNPEGNFLPFHRVFS